jgi:hypothetical protein
LWQQKFYHFHHKIHAVPARYPMPLTATKKYDVEALGWNTLAGYLLGMGSLKTVTF